MAENKKVKKIKDIRYKKVFGTFAALSGTATVVAGLTMQPAVEQIKTQFPNQNDSLDISHVNRPAQIDDASYLETLLRSRPDASTIVADGQTYHNVDSRAFTGIYDIVNPSTANPARVIGTSTDKYHLTSQTGNEWQWDIIDPLDYNIMGQQIDSKYVGTGLADGYPITLDGVTYTWDAGNDTFSINNAPHNTQLFYRSPADPDAWILATPNLHHKTGGVGQSLETLILSGSNGDKHVVDGTDYFFVDVTLDGIYTEANPAPATAVATIPTAEYVLDPVLADTWVLSHDWFFDNYDLEGADQLFNSPHDTDFSSTGSWFLINDLNPVASKLSIEYVGGLPTITDTQKSITVDFRYVYDGTIQSTVRQLTINYSYSYQEFELPTVQAALTTEVTSLEAALDAAMAAGLNATDDWSSVMDAAALQSILTGIGYTLPVNITIQSGSVSWDGLQPDTNSFLNRINFTLDYNSTYNGIVSETGLANRHYSVSKSQSDILDWIANDQPSVLTFPGTPPGTFDVVDLSQAFVDNGELDISLRSDIWFEIVTYPVPNNDTKDITLTYRVRSTSYTSPDQTMSLQWAETINENIINAVTDTDITPSFSLANEPAAIATVHGNANYSVGVAGVSVSNATGYTWNGLDNSKDHTVDLTVSIGAASKVITFDLNFVKALVDQAAQAVIADYTDITITGNTRQTTMTLPAQLNPSVLAGNGVKLQYSTDNSTTWTDMPSLSFMIPEVNSLDAHGQSRLYIRVVSADTNNFVVTDSGDDYLKTSGGANQVDSLNVWFDTSGVITSAITLTGSSFDINNFTEPTGTEYEIQYSLNGGLAPTAQQLSDMHIGSANAWMSKTELRALFNGTGGNLWHEDSKDFAVPEISIQLVPTAGYSLSSDRRVDVPLANFGMAEYIDIASIISDIDALLRITGHNQAPVASNISGTTTTLNNYGLDIFYTTDTNAAYASSVGWGAAGVLPTSYDFFSANRHLSYKILPQAGHPNFELSVQTKQDITASSQIQGLQTWVDTAVVDLSFSKFSGNTNSFTIDESTTGRHLLSDPTAIDIMYQATGPAGLNSGWLETTAFNVWLEANPSANRTAIEAKVQPANANYLISDDRATTILDISELYSYVDISTERAELGNIQLYGTAEIANGAAFSVSSSLSNTNLSAIGIKLQYTLNGTDWLDASIGSVSADSTNGIPSITNGQLIHLERPNAGSAPIIRFRLTPFENDLGVDITGSVAGSLNDYTGWVDASYVHTSEVDTTRYIAGTWDASVVIENKDAQADVLPVLVNTDPTNLAGIVIQGDSNNPIITEVLTGGITPGQDLGAQNPAKPDYDGFIKVAYSIIDSGGRSLSLRSADFTAWLEGTLTNSGGNVMNGSNPVMAYDAQGVELPLPVANISPDWNTIQADTVEAKWVSIDPLYKVNNNNATVINTTNFSRWTDVSALLTRGQAITATGGHSDAVTWSSIAALLTDAATLGLKVQFAVGTAQPSYNTGGAWQDTIPTDVEFEHSARRLWFQIIDDGNGHTVSDQTVQNLTSTSGIDAIDARVETHTIDMQDAIFTVDTFNANINEAAVNWTSAADSSVIEIVYSTDGIVWRNEADFVPWLNANPGIRVGDIEAKVQVRPTAGAYIILPGEDNLSVPDTTTFHSYLDITAEANALSTINIWGISDKVDAAAYTVPAGLTTAALSARGLMLQFTLDGTTWNSSSLGTISPADGTGIPNNSAGEIITLNRPSSSLPPIIRFRVVPIADEDGNNAGTSVNEDNYVVFSDDSKMNLSDYVAGGYNAANVIVSRDSAADTLATQVNTDNSRFDELTIAGNTKNPVLTEVFTGNMDYVAYLASLNVNKPDYSSGIKIAYSVIDTNGRSYWMLETDFVEYLSGDLTTAGANVENTSGQTVVVWDDANNMVNLPAASVAPDWNSIDITSFEAKWTSSDTSMSPNNTAPAPITASGIVMWIDIAGLVAQAQTDVRATGGDSDDVVWASTAALEAAATALGLQVQFSHSDTMPTWASTASWDPTLDTTVNFIHNTRKVWVKFLDDGTLGNVVSDEVVYDLTALSNIEDIIARIDTSVLNPTLAELIGSQADFDIDETQVGYNNVPITTAAEVLYSVGASGWLNRVDFIAWFSSAANTVKPISAIEVKVETTNATLYVVRAGDELLGSPDITSLYSYVDITAERNDLANIQLYGTAEVSNGAAYEVASSLSNANLAVLGIKMQYTLDGTTWVDANVSAVASDSVNGIPSIANGELIFLQRPNPGAAPIIRFRLIPFEDDLGTDISGVIVGSPDDYLPWVEASRVHTSEVDTAQYLLGTWDESVVVEDKDAAADTLPALVTTDPANLAGITIQGDSKFSIITETLLGGNSPSQDLGAQNPGKPDYEPFIKIVYSIIDGNGRSLWLRSNDFTAWLEGTLTNNGGTVENGGNPVTAYTDLGASQPLPVANITPDWNTIQPNTVEAKWVSIDPLYKANNNNSVPVITTAFERWTDVSAIVAQSLNVTATGGHSDLVVWSDITTMIADATALGLKVQFAVGPTQPAYNSGGAWQDTIPTDVAFEHSARRLWFQVIDDGNGHVVSDLTVHNITGTSAIDTIDARVVTTSIDVTDVDFTIDPYNATIEETRIDWTSAADPSVIELVYSSDNTNWYSLADFIAELRNNPEVRVADIESKVVVRAGAGAYIILPGEENQDFPDTTNFYSYKDISAEAAELINIDLHGITDKTDASAFTVPNALRTATLATRGLMLQFTLDGTDWENANLGSISAADGAGIPTHANGQIVTMTRPSAGQPPIIRFRIVPIADEDGNAGGVAVTEDNYSLFVDGNRMHLSDYVDVAYVEADIESVRDTDADMLAIQVLTDPSEFNQLTIHGDTKNPTLTEEFTNGMNYSAYLAALNPGKPDYSADVRIAYAVTDTNGRSFWMLQSDFIEYLRGDLVVNGAVVENTSGQTVVVWDDANNIVNLPIANVEPDWNSIDILTFEAKWVSSNANLILDNTTSALIESSGIVMWIDIAGLVAQAQTDIRATGGDSDAIVWSSTAALEAAAAALGLKVEYSRSDTAPSWGTGASWSSTLATDANFIHADRNIWVQFLDDGMSRNVVSTPIVFDLTAISDIQTIIARISNTGLFPELAELAGSQADFDIDETQVGYNSLAIPTAAEALYSVGTSGWLNRVDFIAWFSSAANANKPRTQIRVKIETTDPLLYTVRSGEDKENDPDITNLYSYVDITAEVTEMNNIQLFGTAEVVDGAAYSVAASLSNANLANLGVKMQYTLDGTTWTNANVGAVAADNTNGIPAIANGELVYLVRPNAGAAPIIRFRIVPFEDDLGNDISSSVTNFDTYEDWIDASYVHTSEVNTSEWLLGTWDSSIVIVDKDAAADQLPVLVITGPTNLAGITIQADSKFAILTEVLTGAVTPGQDLGAQNPGKPDYEPFIKVAYSLIDVNGRSLWLRSDDLLAWLEGTLNDNGGVVENSGVPVLAYDDQGVEQPLPVANIYPDWNTIQPNTVEAKWVSIDPLFKANNNASVPIDTSGFNRWTDVTGITTQTAAITATGGHSDLVVWSDITTMLADATTLGLKVQFAVGPTQPSYNAGPEWQDTIPTDVAFEHSARRLWFQVIDDGNGHVVSDLTVHNLTSTTSIDLIDARVVTTSIDVTNVDFRVDAFNANIEETRIDWTSAEDPSVIELVYSSDNTNWYTLNDFIVELRNNPEVRVADIESKVVVRPGAGAYIILPGEENQDFPDTTLFNSYKDISTESAELANIDLFGITDKVDAAAFTVPNALRTTTLAASGLMLQFTLDGTDWENAVLGSISSADGQGIPAHANGQIVTMTRPSSAQPPIIRFRIVPIADEDGNGGGTSVGEDTYTVFVDDNKMNLSDYVAGGYNPANIISDRDADADLLAIQVLTDHTRFGELTISGDTKHPLLTEQFTGGLDYAAYLASLNPNKPDYSAGVKISYTVTDINGKSYWMLESDFVEYLRGDLTVISTWVENTSGQRVMSWDDAGNYVDLPVANVAPDWNSIDIYTFEAKWVSSDAGLVPDNTTFAIIDSYNIVMWIDIAGLVAQAQTDIRATGGDSDDVVWSSTAALEAAAAALGLRVEYSKQDTMPTWASTASWDPTLNTDINFIHNTRRVWVKFLDDGTSGNVVSDEVVYDLTTLSDIASILARIDTSQMDPHLAQLIGNETSLTIDETAVGYGTIPIPTAAELLYSVGTSGWLNSADFIAWFENPANTNKPRAQIQVKIETTDGTLYIVRPGEDKTTNPGIDDLYSYNDVTAEVAGMTGIALHGVLGKTDGVVYEVPTSLTMAVLDARGLKLQFTLDGTMWADSNLVASIVPDPVNGIGNIPGNHGELITVPKPVVGDPVISFRLVSTKDDEGNVNPVADSNDYLQHVEANKVHLSDYVAGGYNPTNVEISHSNQAANLPTLVITFDTTNYLDQITINGDTRDATITETFTVASAPGQSWADVLSHLNPNNNFSTVIKVAYALDDGNGLPFYLEAADFERWLGNNFTTAGSDVMDGARVIWGWDATGVYTQMPVSKVSVDYNSVDYDTFGIQAKWVSNDTLFRPTDSASTQISYGMASFKKWIDVQAYMDRLEVLSIDGHTRDLNETEIANILADIQAEFGANHGIQIEVTSVLAGATPDWTGASIDSLPPTMNLLYELAFRITDNGASKHAVSTTATVGTFDPEVIWDHATANASTLIDKYINVDRDLLATYLEMNGDTLNIDSVQPANIINSDDDGEMSAFGTFNGVEVLYAIRGVAGINASSMPLDIFREYLSNQLTWTGGQATRPGGAAVDPIYGFTALNINVIHDGTWGRDSIFVGYTFLPGFYIDPAQDGLNGVMDKQVTTTTVDRYIDITTLVDEATTNAGVLIVGDATRGWWDEVSGAYDDHKTWGGYVDSQDLSWDISTLLTNPGALHAQIEYSMDNGAWTTTPLTSTVDAQGARNLRVRFVNGANYATGEAPVLSDYSFLDVTTPSRLQQVETHINIGNPALSNVELSGLTNGPNISEAAATVPANSEIHYSLTEFKDGNHPDSLARLAVMGLDTPAKITASGYTASMTSAQFLAFINANNINPDFTQVIRSFIGVRLVADADYSINPVDDAGSRSDADVDNLYTYKDVAAETVQFVYQSGGNPGDAGGIGLFGQKTTIDGVAVSLPASLTLPVLALNGLKLQYTMDSNDGINMAPAPAWIDATTAPLSGGGKPGVPSTIPNGFWVTMTPQAGGNAFIGFRLIPIEDDLGNVTTGDTPTWTLDQYFDDTKTKPQDHNGTDVQDVYPIDTSQIPTVVNTNSTWLSGIQFAGSTRYATIHETQNGYAGGTPINDLIDTVNTDTSLKNSLEVWYALDKLDGTSIAGTGDLVDGIWLNKADMEAYLNGDLEIVSNRVVYRANNNIEVTALTNATVVRAEPDYLNLDIDQIWSKFISNNNSYIPSDTTEVNHISTPGLNPINSFRKWFDGEDFRTAITNSVVNGHTESYVVTLDPAGTIDASELTRHGLQLEYALSAAGPWTTSLPDFMAANWQTQVDRLLFAQVVPTGGNVSADFKETDRLIIEYTGDRHTRTITNSTTGGVRDFQLYVDVAKVELAAIDVKGNQYKLDDGFGDEGLGLDETAVDTNTDKYTQVEIQYLFDGTWYNKVDLIAEMTRIRSLTKDGSVTMPTDFGHNNVSAKWVVLDTDDAVIAAGQDLDNPTTANLLKNFINFWDVQDITGTFVNGPTEYDLTGSINAATMTWAAAGSLGSSQLVAYGLTAQWTTVENPSDDIDAPEWQNATSNSEVLRDVLLDPNHRSLRVRFIPSDRTTSDSSTFASLEGNDSNIQHIIIDTSAMRYEVGVSSSVFTNMPVSGDTQQNLYMDNTQYVGAPWLGVTMENVDSSGNAVAVPDVEKPQWFTDVGLTTQVRVVATRNKGGYVAGNTYEFNDIGQFYVALATKDLNFDRSTLEVSWGIVPTKSADFTVSDATWVRPLDADTIVNIVYTEDITTLVDDSYIVGGNNLLLAITQNDAALDTNALLALGVKVEYNIESINNTPNPIGWTDIVPAFLHEDKNIWIRFAPINADYGLGDDVLSGDQETKLDVAATKVAIVLDSTWLDQLTNTTLVGNTWDIAWGTQWPSVPESYNPADPLNPLAFGRPEFTIETDNGAGGVIWGLDGNYLTDILFDQYGKALMLDKDRDPHVRIQYNINPGQENNYEFTDPTGVAHSVAGLTKTVDISQLTQPVFTDWNDARIGNVDWLTFANSPDFKALFTPGTTDLTASLEAIKYNGEDVGANGNNSFYDLDVNVFDPTDRHFRDAINALAPRNTTFEFRARNSASASWSGWSSIMPTDIIRSTTFNGFEVRIVADAGYVIPDGFNATDWLGAWGDQTWSREYNVVIERNTEGVQANTADYIGFDALNGVPGTGRFITDDPDKNYNLGLPEITLIAQDGSLFLDLWEPSPAYVLEYKVTDRFGADIVWTDENLITAAGWHAFSTPPSASMSPFGFKPIDLSNGNVVHMRLRARNGYVIIDPNSDDPAQHAPDWNGYVSWSESTTFPMVSGLVTEIDKAIVDSQEFFDPNNAFDMSGNPIIIDSTMPQITFSGHEDTGSVNITTGTTAIRNQFDVEVIVLEPYIPQGLAFGAAVNGNQLATFGYVVRNAAGNPVFAYLTAAGVQATNGGYSAGWQDGFDEVPGVWKDPSTINDLYVGAAILPRITPRTGYGFRWEDGDNSFDDEAFPKYTAEFYYNRNVGNAGQGGVLEDFTPIPVRGLLLYPPTVPSNETLVYSTLDYQVINGNAQLSMSWEPHVDDKWRWRFDIVRKTTGSSEYGLTSLPFALDDGSKNNIYNGDSIYVWIEPVNPSYILDPAFVAQNNKFELVVSGLRDDINSVNVPRPLLTLDGYEGEALLSDINEQNNGGTWVDYDRTGNGLPVPALDSTVNALGGVKWEYQIFDGNPNNAISSEINSVPWSDSVPSGLVNGQWVRARLAPIDSKDIVYPAVYSFGSAEAANEQNEHHLGWTQVTDLFINPVNLTPTTRVTGYDYRTTFTVLDEGTLDDNAVEWEAMVVGWDGATSLWYGQDDWSNPPFTTLSNGDMISIRAKASDGYKFNPNDNGEDGGNISIIVDPDDSTKYLARHNDWNDIEVDNLLNYLDVSSVTLDQVNTIRDHRHPTAEDIINNPDEFPSMDPDNDILNGFATLTDSQMNNLHSVRDVNGNTTDASGNPYSDKLAFRYLLRRFDIDSGNLSPEVEWIPSTGTLGINDEIIIEVYSVDENYALSRAIRRTVIITGLIQAPPENQAAPVLSFAGESGAGTVNVTPAANSGFKWQYATWREGEDEPDFTLDGTWYDNPPVDLENGWNVAVKLASTLGGIIHQDFNTGWVLVTGLRQRIDLSGVQVMGFDPLNPYDPTKVVDSDNIFNVAFKLVGDQEGHSYLEINAPIVSSNPEEQLRDLEGDILPFAEYLQWEFAYSTAVGNSSVSSYSYSLPKGLRNGTLIHVRLAPKDGVTGIEVYGFQTMTIEVNMLTPEASVSNQLMILLGIGAGGALAFTSLIALGVVVKSRKKRMI